MRSRGVRPGIGAPACSGLGAGPQVWMDHGMDHPFVFEVHRVRGEHPAGDRRFAHGTDDFGGFAEAGPHRLHGQSPFRALAPGSPFGEGMHLQGIGVSGCAQGRDGRGKRGEDSCFHCASPVLVLEDPACVIDVALRLAKDRLEHTLRPPLKPVLDHVGVAMQFEFPMIEGRLIRRYKRFLADVVLPDGTTVTAHTPNTGSMLGCCTPGSRVWLRDSGSSTRKYPLSWELVETEAGALVGINTGLSNALVREAIESGVIHELGGYAETRAEVRYGAENSRIDLLLRGHAQAPDCYVEVKNVTLADGDAALFPDAVSVRASKHLRELAAMVDQGFRACLCFCIQRQDVGRMRPADHIDAAYGRHLREAMAAGVEVLAYRARVAPGAIALADPLPVECPELSETGARARFVE